MGFVSRMLKIDTETNEPEVLAGRPEQRLMNVLAPFDCLWFRIDDDLPLIAPSEIVGDPTYAHTNWLLAPTRPSTMFWMEMAWWSDLDPALPLAPDFQLDRREGSLPNQDVFQSSSPL